MSEMRKRIDEDKTTLESTMKNTVSNASENAEEITGFSGRKLGREYMTNTNKTIETSEQELKKTIEKVATNATNQSSESVFQDSKTLGITAIEGVKQGENGQTNSLRQTTNSVIATATSNINLSTTETIGRNIISGIKAGINGNSWSLYSAMTSLGNTLLRTFKNAMGIHSPSKEMADLAKFIPLGIAEGIDATSDKAVGSMKNLVQDIKDTADGMGDIEYNTIPKVSSDAVTYLPRQSISTNAVQNSIANRSDDMLSQLLHNFTNRGNGQKIEVTLNLDGNQLLKQILSLNDDYNFATNGGGL